MTENQLTDIFTDLDDSIFSDGSIDPMGLRMIWTSLGNRIFGNRLNTISTDIRFYTLNLFHHHLLYACEKDHEDKFVNLIGIPPYNNRDDLREGIIIYLECLLTQSITKAIDQADQSDGYNVPGISKLKGLKLNRPNDVRVKCLSVNKNVGILVRQLSLGIHGRHKGPFQEMGIFNRHDYYANTPVWKKANELFAQVPWISLANSLTTIINNRILNAPHRQGSIIKMGIETICSDELVEAYKEIMQPENFRQQPIVDFWEEKLGLLSGTAGNIYKQLKISGSNVSYQDIISKASLIGVEEENRPLLAICAIEPFLTCIEKIVNCLLKRGTSYIDDDILNFVNKWIKNTDISPSIIGSFFDNRSIDEEALKRLKKLIAIYQEAKQTNDSLIFIKKIVSYHTEIMKTRNNLPWVSIGNKNSVTVHRSYMFNQGEIAFLENSDWVNSYYLPTLKSLHRGLYFA